MKTPQGEGPWWRGCMSPGGQGAMFEVLGGVRVSPVRVRGQGRAKVGLGVCSAGPTFLAVWVPR